VRKYVREKEPSSTNETVVLASKYMNREGMDELAYTSSILKCPYMDVSSQDRLCQSRWRQQVETGQGCQGQEP